MVLLDIAVAIKMANQTLGWVRGTTQVVCHDGRRQGVDADVGHSEVV